ncbi:MAG: hypothetical protein EP330_11665 [Deltaproteobacteria bacterium]|nr:MAG: hypothetical protein EP330_11665 [Deltaproteobacteria bacterium]
MTHAKAHLAAALLTVGLASAAPRAEALDPFMWGVGPRIGTNAIPAAYPLTLPPYLRDPDNGSTIERTSGDLFVGVDAVYYATGHTRVGLLGGIGFGLGSPFFDGHVIFRYNYVSQTGAMDFLLGGGAGFGTSKWSGERSESLRVPYYPLRAEASALVRDNSRGYQGTVFFQYNLPANHFYTNADGVDVDIGTGIYPTLGIEFSVLFGDFTPPRPRRRTESPSK